MEPPSLKSEGTFQITGRGIMKVLRLADLPKGYKIGLGDPVRIDDQDWRCVGIERYATSPPRETGGILVRPLSDQESPRSAALEP